jgi:hypothetical protein
MDTLTIDPKLQAEYNRILDIKITEYDSQLNEVSNIEYNEELMMELLNIVKTIDNGLDVEETILFKTAAKESVPINLLYRDIDGTIEYIYKKINPLHFTSLEDIQETFKILSPYLKFEDFIEGMIWESVGLSDSTEENSEIVKTHLQRFIDISDSTKESWEDKKTSWLEEDTAKINIIYARQMTLLQNSIQPDIYKNYMTREFTVKHRDLYFDVRSLDNKSIYDKFIFISPTCDIPFVKLNLVTDVNESEVYKIYSRCTRDNLNTWIDKDGKMEKDTPFIAEDYIYFLVKIEDLSNGYIECYLSDTALVTKVPTSYSIETIQDLLSDFISERLNITLSEPREKKIKMTTFLEHFPHIEPALFQFYLVSNDFASVYVEETESNFSNERRKRKIFYKPVSELSDVYRVKYDKGNANLLHIEGPNEYSTINFFINIFGRTMQAFFLRQDAIKLYIPKIIFGDSYNMELKINKATKKKKDSSALDAHLKVPKKRIDQLKGIVRLPPNYSTNCICARQPIIFTEDEAKAWQDSKKYLYDKTGTKDVPKNIKEYTLENGKVIFFACPGKDHPIISLVNQKKLKEGSIEFNPCCYGTAQEGDTEGTENIKTVKAGSAMTGKSSTTKTSIKRYSYGVSGATEEINARTKVMHLSQELKHLIRYLSRSDEIDEPEDGSDIQLIAVNAIITTNAFLEAVVDALNPEDLTFATEYRKKISAETNPMLFSQEAIGLEKSPIDIYEDFKNPKFVMDSKVHYRALEEYFKIHIYVFEMKDPDIKYWNVESNFSMERPLSKIYSLRVLYPNRPCVILVRNGDQYNIVTKKSSATFSPDMSAKLMDLYHYLYETSSMTYNSITRNSSSVMNWDNFFEDDPIVAQEIDIAGKTRVIKLKSGATIAIPPTQPLNVPLIERYVTVERESVIDFFGKPSSWDETGMWYPLFGVPNQFYILADTSGLGVPSEETRLHTPLMPFVLDDDKRKDLEIERYRHLKRSTYALIQIIHWAWRVDSRPDFRRWFARYTQITNLPEDIMEMTPEDDIRITLPVWENGVTQGFKEIHEWWPSMLTSSGKIRVWTSLKEKIEAFFDREESIVGSSTMDPISVKLTGFYNNSGDYPKDENIRVFIGRTAFLDWSRTDRVREENPELRVYSTFRPVWSGGILGNEASGSIEVIGLNDLAQKSVPIRVAYKNHWVILRNLEDKSLESAVEESRKLAKFPKGGSNVIVLAFSKKNEIVDSDIITNAAANAAANTIYVLKYPNGTYASISLLN